MGAFNYVATFQGVRVVPAHEPLTEYCRSKAEIKNLVERLKTDLDALQPILEKALQRELAKGAFDDA